MEPSLEEITIDRGQDNDNFMECAVKQLYAGGSALGVECRVCGAEQTSGSWRRGWSVAVRLSDVNIPPIIPESGPNANLCNRCGQRWAKMGKATSPRSVRSSMAQFVHASNRPRRMTGTTTNDPPSESKVLRNGGIKFGKNTCEGSKYIGYAIKKASDGRITYALFWLMDQMEHCVLVAIGIDPRSSGHFTYHNAPLLSGHAPPLKCTNRSDTSKWIETNFGVTRALSAGLKSKVPAWDAPRIQQELQRGQDGSSSLLQQQQQQQLHLCAMCGCNHPTESCPSGLVVENSSLGLHTDALDGLGHHPSDEPDIQALFNSTPDEFVDRMMLEGDVDVSPVGLSPLQGIFFSSSPKDMATSPTIIHAASGNKGLGGQNILCKSASGTATSTSYHLEEESLSDWANSLPPSVVESAFKAWSIMIDNFSKSLKQTPGDIHEVLTVLYQLLECKKVDFQLLSVSNLSSNVARLCNHSDHRLSLASRQLVERWRSEASALVARYQ